MKRWALIFLLGTAGCAGMSILTRQDFVKYVTDKRFLSEEVVYTVDRPFADVIGSLKQFRADCLSRVIEWRDRSGPGHGTETLHGEVKVTRPSRSAEFSYQVLPHPGPVNKIPEKGIYVFAADIEALGAKKTRITTYRGTVATAQFTAAFHAFSEGKKVDCPEVDK
jgi:hypothetical protein